MLSVDFVVSFDVLVDEGVLVEFWVELMESGEDALCFSEGVALEDGCAVEGLVLLDPVEDIMSDEVPGLPLINR